MLVINTPPHTTTEQHFFIMSLSLGKRRAFVQEVNPDVRVNELVENQRAVRAKRGR